MKRVFILKTALSQNGLYVWGGRPSDGDISAQKYIRFKP